VFRPSHLRLGPIFDYAPGRANSLQLPLAFEMGLSPVVPRFLFALYQYLVNWPPVSRQPEAHLLVIESYLKRKRSYKVVNRIVLDHYGAGPMQRKDARNSLRRFVRVYFGGVVEKSHIIC